MEFTAVPGVGEKTAESLAELDDAERAIAEGDVAALARAPGISEGRAAQIARGAIRDRHGDDGDFLGTDRAREIYDAALGLLQDRTVTDYAAQRMRTFYPTSAESRIEEVREYVDRALERDPNPAVRDALTGVEPLDPAGDVRVRDRCLATADAETLAAAEAAVPELPVEVVDDRRELGDLARSYSSVVVLDAEFAGMDLAGDVTVQPDALEEPEELVPERTLAFFARNRERLLAAAEVHEALADAGDDGAGAGDASGDAGDSETASNDSESAGDPPCDLDALREGLARVDDDGTVVGDAEFDRLRDAVDDLDAAVSTAESVADDHLREVIRERDVTIEGQDFLSLVEQGARVDSLLDRELADDYDRAIELAREHLVESLSLRPEEADLAERVFRGEPSFPVERNDDAVARLRTELTAARDRTAAELKRGVAADLRALREPAEALVREALELDVELAVARFAREYGCTIPAFRDSGVAIEGGRSPLLDVDFAEVEPVDYEVDGVNLLSGVNSGGKTSTLDLVALVVVLAHMGLPVPADRPTLQRFSGLHYYAKSQGTLDAGAFEATLQEFGAVVGAEDAGGAAAADRLVLVDELESITEPGASAKIIAGILEELDRQDATAIFVSHLAADVRAAADVDVAVDGIEAVGLVDGELEVNRSPVKDHLARSTPELIVEKLAGDGGGFYEGLLEKFEETGD